MEELATATKWWRINYLQIGQRLAYSTLQSETWKGRSIYILVSLHREGSEALFPSKKREQGRIELHRKTGEKSTGARNCYLPLITKGRADAPSKAEENDAAGLLKKGERKEGKNNAMLAAHRVSI